MIYEDSKGLGGGNLNPTKGPCIPCAGLKREMIGSSIVDSWENHWGLRANILSEIPYGLEKCFPVGMDAETLTRFWWNAHHLHLELRWSYYAHGFGYNLVDGLYRLIELPENSYNYSVVERADHELTRGVFNQPPRLQTALNVHVQDNPERPDYGFNLAWRHLGRAALGCFDFLPTSIIPGCPLANPMPAEYDSHEGFSGVRVAKVDGLYFPEIIWAVQDRDEISNPGQDGSLFALNNVDPDWPLGMVRRAYEVNLPLTVNYSILGATATTTAFLRWDFAPYSTSGTGLDVLPATITNDQLQTLYQDYPAIMTTGFCFQGSSGRFISNLSAELDFTIT